MIIQKKSVGNKWITFKFVATDLLRKKENWKREREMEGERERGSKTFNIYIYIYESNEYNKENLSITL